MTEQFRGMPIFDGAMHFGHDFAARHAQIRQQARERLRVTVPGPEVACVGTPLPARVDANRWIVDCPDCGSAEFAFVADARFLCTNCLNATVGGACRPVAFPRNRQAIEAALLLRPVPRTRDWRPGETVAQLRRENRDNGITEASA